MNNHQRNWSRDRGDQRRHESPGGRDDQQPRQSRRDQELRSRDFDPRRQDQEYQRNLNLNFCSVIVQNIKWE